MGYTSGRRLPKLRLYFDTSPFDKIFGIADMRNRQWVPSRSKRRQAWRLLKVSRLGQFGLAKKCGSQKMLTPTFQTQGSSNFISFALGYRVTALHGFYWCTNVPWFKAKHNIPSQIKTIINEYLKRRAIKNFTFFSQVTKFESIQEKRS